MCSSHKGAPRRQVTQPADLKKELPRTPLPINVFERPREANVHQASAEAENPRPRGPSHRERISPSPWGKPLCPGSGTNPKPEHLATLPQDACEAGAVLRFRCRQCLKTAHPPRPRRDAGKVLASFSGRRVRVSWGSRKRSRSLPSRPIEWTFCYTLIPLAFRDSTGSSDKLHS